MIPLVTAQQPDFLNDPSLFIAEHFVIVYEDTDVGEYAKGIVQIEVIGDIAYSIAEDTLGGGSFQTVNISDPSIRNITNPDLNLSINFTTALDMITNNISFPFGLDVQVEGNVIYAYVTGGSKVWIYNVTDPKDIILIDNISVALADAIQIRGDTAYVSSTAQSKKIHTINITGKTVESGFAIINTTNIPAALSIEDIDVRGDILYAVANMAPPGQGSIITFNISDPADIQPISVFSTINSDDRKLLPEPSGIRVDDDLIAYVATIQTDTKFFTFNVSDPTNITLLDFVTKTRMVGEHPVITNFNGTKIAYLTFGSSPSPLTAVNVTDPSNIICCLLLQFLILLELHLLSE